VWFVSFLVSSVLFMVPAASPRLLLLETSGRAGFVAVAEGETLLAVRQLDEARRHARDLAPAVADLLAGQGWQPRDLHSVIVSRGPGSYTGLRVGIMSAKALAYATGCALLTIDSFTVIAAQAPPEAQRVDVLADAQQDKVYVQPFGRAGDGWQPLAALAVVPFEEWLARKEPDAWLTGPGLRRWVDRLPNGVRATPAECWDPQPQSLLHLGVHRYRAGERDDVWSVEPLYLRPSSAEEQWRARAK
jgi:tRNA threonylcarbamoyladenosine biosynthesis protein TsaB